MPFVQSANIFFYVQTTQANKKIFVQRQRMLNRFEVLIGGAESENALSFAELALVLEIFLLLFFIILLERGEFSSMQSFFNVILLVSQSKFSVHLLHTTGVGNLRPAAL